jgi:amidophosphoribosyltransferase
MGEPARDPLAPRFCDACFTGDYPIPLIDADDGKVSVQLSLLAEPA